MRVGLPTNGYKMAALRGPRSGIRSTPWYRKCRPRRTTRYPGAYGRYGVQDQIAAGSLSVMPVPGREI